MTFFPCSLLFFLFSTCFSCWFSSAKINVIENPTLNIQCVALLALNVCLPRCMLEGCIYSTKVEGTVSGFSTDKCEKYFSQYIKHGNYNW